MALSEAQVCNLALLRVGSRAVIQNLEEKTAEAIACKAIFELARDAVLAEVPWSFATRRATLALISGATRDGWQYVYDVPADFLAARYIYAGIRNPASDERIPFALEDDVNNELVLLTDAEDAVLVYTYRCTSPGLWSPLFVDALAWRLASDLALALSVKPQVGLAMAQGYEAALRKAAAADWNQQREDMPPEAEWIRKR